MKMTMSSNKEQKSALLFGARLARERKRLGLSQKEAAERCGVRREMWGRYERGVAEPGVAVLEHFRALGADPGALLGDVAKEETDTVTAAAVAIIDEFCAQLGLHRYDQEIWEIGNQLLEDRRTGMEQLAGEEISRRRRTRSLPEPSGVRGSVLMRAVLLKSPFVVDDEAKGALRGVIEDLEYELQHSGKKIAPREKAHAVVNLWIKATDRDRLSSGATHEIQRYVADLP